MYRSFVSCDDPKGVVECETIRKYRSCSQTRKKIKIQKTTENLETSLMSKRYRESKVPKGSSGGNFIGPSSFHLIQVSGGDQRLNNMIIDSWSSELMYDGRSEDTAKDLLKRALDMQDSLIMLHKLQEASQHKARFKRKQTEKPKRDRIHAKMIGRMHTSQFSEQSNPKGFQRPQPSANGSSSNYTEELKKVIKESLVSQNMFTSTDTEGLDSAPEAPSTSPSQSSRVRTDRLADPSFSLRASKMEKGSNLVAKLMGLEEAPSRSFPAIKQKHLDGEKIMNEKRPVSEIDLPKERKNNSIAEKVNPEQKALRQTLDRVHFKGLLKKYFVKEPKLQVHHLNDPNSKQFDDLSHIALMKLIEPRSTPYQESVKTQTPVPPEELSMSKLKAEVVSSKTIRQRKGSSSTTMGKETEKDASKRLAKEKGPKFLKEVVKLDAKGINPIEESSSKVKLYCHVSHTSRENETSDKKFKVHTISRQLPERDTSEPRIVRVARPQDQREITSTKLRKPLSGLRIDKNEISFLNSTDSNTISISKTESLKINNCKDLSMEIKESDSVQDSLARGKNQVKNLSSAAEPEAAKPIAEQTGHKSIDVPGKDDYTEIRIATTQADELMTQSKVREAGETDSNPDKEGAELKKFLLSSESFIGQAEKLFNLDVMMDCPKTKILQKDETNGVANLSLYLDCANELTVRRSLQGSQAVRSFSLTFAGNSRLRISLRRLVEEIYDAIENLKFYEKLFADNLFAMTENDIRCNEVMNGIWEGGWRRGFSADEAELVVTEVESQLVSGLIEEFIINL